jgi:group I intron endonuclease
MPRPISQEEAIARFRQQHGDRYDYSRMRYESSAKKVEVVCQEHGAFFIAPQHHWDGAGCSKCAFERARTTKDGFVERAKQFFGERYDYSLFEVLPPFGHKIPIRCCVHEVVFEQEARNHMRGHVGCPECKSLKLAGPRGERGALHPAGLLTMKFIERARQVHGERYDYSHFVYTTSSAKGVIVCRQHGEFSQSPGNHLSGSGCPVCAREDAGSGSFKTRCKELGVDYWRALKRREAGMSEEKVFSPEYVREDRETSPIMLDGKTYPNLKAAVRALGSVASTQTIARRLIRGMTPEEALRTVPNPGYAKGIIYQVTHIESGRHYVGQTVTTLDRRWEKHVGDAHSRRRIKSEASLHAAVRKYGADAFKIEQIDTGVSNETLEIRERFWIEKLGSLCPNGYNILKGGGSGGSNPKPCTVDGKKFRSVGEAAEYVAESRGISLDAAKMRLRKNRLNARKPATKGQSLVKTAAYKTWSRIVHCVLNPRSKDHIPGLDVCEKWRTSDGFLATVEQPPEPGMAFVRLDKKRGFFPENCAWMSKRDASKLNAAHMKAAGKLTGRKKR